jgi:Spy/CpxP family protein refolding chaperone
MKRTGLLIVAAVTAAAVPAFAGDGHTRRERMRAAAWARLRAFESLGFSAEQRQLMIGKAKAIAPIVDAARTEARRLVADGLVEARTGDREAIRARVKEAVRAIRRDTVGRIAPLARDVVASLTPEQRAKIAEFAAKRGKTVDDEMLVRRFGRALARPMTLAYLEAIESR